jgi:acid phosphatase family membrane protein YuiD
MELLHEFFRVLPALLYLEAVLFLLLFGIQSGFWLFMCIGFLVNGMIWVIATKVTDKYIPHLSKRPNRKHCYYLEDNSLATSSGLPSGHCQGMAFFATWVLLFMTFNRRVPYYIFMPTVALLVWATWYMMYTRVKVYRCHTYNQASAGTIIGILTAIILWYIKTYLKFNN